MARARRPGVEWRADRGGLGQVDTAKEGQESQGRIVGARQEADCQQAVTELGMVK